MCSRFGGCSRPISKAISSTFPAHRLSVVDPFLFTWLLAHFVIPGLLRKISPWWFADLRRVDKGTGKSSGRGSNYAKTGLHHDPIRSDTAKAKYANVKHTQDTTSQDGCSHRGNLSRARNDYEGPEIASDSALCGCKSQHNGAHRESFSHNLSSHVLREIARRNPTCQ